MSVLMLSDRSGQSGLLEWTEQVEIIRAVITFDECTAERG